MKNKLFIFLLTLCIYSFAQQTAQYPRILSRTDKPLCENEVKVKDVKVATCAPDNCHSHMYPVIIENFDYKFDLPNKWRFDLGYTPDDDVDGTSGYSTLYCYGYFDKYGNITNNNVQIDGGIAKLVNKYESNSKDGRDYTFTSGCLTSLNNFEYGVFEASIKIPTANKMWPAFWLLGRIGNYSEIDIFEFYDDDVSGSPCDLYNNHKMSLHAGSVPKKNECHRSDKYPMVEIDDFHTYKLEWNNYEISIYVDGEKKGYATRYYDQSKLDYHCNYGYTGKIDPKYSYNCSALQGLEDNWYEIYWPQKPSWWPNWLYWPSIPEFLYYPNKIRQDSYFPSRDRPMALIMNNSINKKYNGESLSEFSEASQTMQIDWVKVYQPFCCGENKNIATLADFNFLSNNTGFLTGSVINLSNMGGTNKFLQEVPHPPLWTEVPFFFLATDEIQINSEAWFNGEIYTEMRITDCDGNNGFRVQNNSQDNVLSEIENATQKTYSQHKTVELKESIATDSLFEAITTNKLVKYQPSPTDGLVALICNDEQFEKIISLYFTDLNGNKFYFNKNRIIDIKSLTPGYYQIITEFKDGTVSHAKIIKL